MGEIFMFLGNQHHQNVHVTSSNLQIQRDPNQNLNNTLPRARKDDAEIPMEAQETTNSRSSLEG